MNRRGRGERRAILRRASSTNLAILSVLALVLILAACAPTAQFASNSPAAEAPGAMARQPAAVSFVELDADPQTYRDRLVRVSGAYTRLPNPPCEPYKGPPTDWALVDVGLRLDVQGFSRVMELVPEGTDVTVIGFWQRYRGPVGCGKEPPSQTLWYLRAVQLVQPNPLPQLAGLPDEPLEPQEEGVPTPDLEGAPTATPSPTPTATPTPDGTNTPTPTPDLTASPTPTEDPDVTRTPTPTATGDDQDTATPAPTTDPGATPTPGDGDGPPNPTSTPSDYPGPPPEPTETPGPYD